MITIDNVQYRNLEEQVKKNMDDIQYILEEEGVLNEFGIKIVGQITSPSQLPDPDTYQGEYGDAYAVGISAPYTIYIYTRANGSHPNDYWFNIGQFPLAGATGPTGPTGSTGATGTRGSTWTSGAAAPGSTSDRLSGDKYLNTTNGDVYNYTGSAWQLIGNIEGPQGVQGLQGSTGPQGPQGIQGATGPQGDPGQSFIIAGTVATEGQLPDPKLVSDNVAYLVGSNNDFDLYVQLHDTDTWQNVGKVEGVVGPTGPMGEQGPQGPQGVQGETGATGPQGEIGPQGEVGPIGPTGPMGPTGATGPTGTPDYNLVYTKAEANDTFLKVSVNNDPVTTWDATNFAPTPQFEMQGPVSTTLNNDHIEFGGLYVTGQDLKGGWVTPSTTVIDIPIIDSDTIARKIRSDNNNAVSFVVNTSAIATREYVDTSINSAVSSVYKFKGSVATYNDLPTEDLTIGDVYNVTDTGDNYAWTGTTWDKLAGDIDLSAYATTANVQTYVTEQLQPYATTANVTKQLANYLPLTGGTINGRVDINGNIVVSGQIGDAMLRGEALQFSGNPNSLIYGASGIKTSVINEISFPTGVTGIVALTNDIITALEPYETAANVNNKLANYVQTANIVQELGTSTTNVISQYGINTILKGNNVELGINSTAESSSVAIGENAWANVNSSVAIGGYAYTEGISATALGYSGEAYGDFSTAIGYSSNAQSYSSVAIGRQANALSTNSIAIGYVAKTNGSDSITVGHSANTNGTYSIAIGCNARTNNARAIAIGNMASAFSSDSIAIGPGANASGDNNIQLGRGNNYTTNTFQVGNYPLLDLSTGLIPSERIQSGGGITEDYITISSDQTFTGGTSTQIPATDIWSNWKVIALTIENYDTSDILKSWGSSVILTSDFRGHPTFTYKDSTGTSVECLITVLSTGNIVIYPLGGDMVTTSVAYIGIA